MNEYSTDEVNTGVPDLVARCAALESEVARLTADLGDANMLATANNEVATSLHGQLESAHALLRELAGAIRRRDLMDFQNVNDPSVETWLALGDARGKLAEVLRRVDAEAGEAR